MRTVWFCGAIAFVMIGCAVTEDDGNELQTGEADQDLNLAGRLLFNQATFGGNGRVCTTCHGDANGTITPAEIAALSPNDPVFRSIDSDDGHGSSYSLLRANATFNVTIPLPANWSLADNPTARSITLRRAVPTTNNVPSLDTLFMADGRFTTLQDQALGAVNAHYQPKRQPTARELDDIADFEQSITFFSDVRLLAYAHGGPEPTLPPGRTASEKRGRNFIVPSPTGFCGHCHAGPMLNATSQFLIANPEPPVGTRFFTAFVSELNEGHNPVYTFNVRNADGSVTQIVSPDPGRALITGNPADANLFRIPTLWGAVNTGPWFHDNSAKTLQQLTQHYSTYFQIVGLPPLSDQDQQDIIAYLRLLN
ncbi:MAG: cytochrome c peroxidase [Kofleriaceae bacterium]